MSDILALNPRLVVGNGSNGPVVVSPEMFRILNALSYLLTSSGLPVYLGTDFPKDATTPALLVKTDTAGNFLEVIYRGSQPDYGLVAGTIAKVNAEIGKPNLIAGLDANARLPLSQLTLLPFAQNRSVAPPNSTIPAHQLTPLATESDVDAVVTPVGKGGLLAAVPDFNAGGNKRGNYAVDWQLWRDAPGNIASGLFAVVPGGKSNTASGDHSYASGYHASTRGLLGAVARASSMFAADGDCQRLGMTLMVATPGATPTVLTADGNAETTANTYVLPASTAATFTGSVVAKSAADFSHWTFVGGIRNSGGVALTAAVTPTLVSQTAGAAAWSVAVGVNAGNNALKLTVTGAAGTNIKWGCSLDSMEVAG